MHDQEKKPAKAARLTINLPPDLVRKLKIEAVNRALTSGKIVEAALVEYFKSRECKHD